MAEANIALFRAVGRILYTAVPGDRSGRLRLCGPEMLPIPEADLGRFFRADAVVIREDALSGPFQRRRKIHRLRGTCRLGEHESLREVHAGIHTHLQLPGRFNALGNHRRVVLV